MTVTTSDQQEQARSARRASDGLRRRELLAAAASCFGEFGYEATTAQAVTARAGVSRATFYAYFSSREEIFAAVAEQVCQQLLDAQHLEGPVVDDVRAVLRATTEAVIGAYFRYGAIVGLVDHRARLDPAIGELWASVRDRLVGRYTRFIERIADSGEATPCAPPRTVAQTLADAQLVGAARLESGSDDDRAQYISDMIVMSERLIGFA
ncbi:TetR/AcrR family transcriptional regulator [Rhodococcus triatomae]|nr:TetR family transcriptional regulator [Rhodococcus triatomae BKS 15-14]